MLTHEQAKLAVAQELDALKLLTGETILPAREALERFATCLEQGEDWKALAWYVHLTSGAILHNVDDRRLAILMETGGMLLLTIKQCEKNGVRLKDAVPGTTEMVRSMLSSRKPNVTAQYHPR